MCYSINNSSVKHGLYVDTYLKESILLTMVFTNYIFCELVSEIDLLKWEKRHFMNIEKSIALERQFLLNYKANQRIINAVMIKYLC